MFKIYLDTCKTKFPDHYWTVHPVPCASLWILFRWNSKNSKKKKNSVFSVLILSLIKKLSFLQNIWPHKLLLCFLKKLAMPLSFKTCSFTALNVIMNTILYCISFKQGKKYANYRKLNGWKSCSRCMWHNSIDEVSQNYMKIPERRRLSSASS